MTATTARCFLVSYRPLISTSAGRQAEHLGRPPFVDYSCRSEPDFEHAVPAITALCRGKMFAPRLQVGDVVAYATVKGKWLGLHDPHWRLTAVLRIRHRFETHVEAADWYRQHGLVLPRNLMVPGNELLPLEMTAGIPRVPELLAKPAERRYQAWDDLYRLRARHYQTVLSTDKLYLSLDDPPVILPPLLRETTGFTALHQTPPVLPEARFEALLTALGIELPPTDDLADI